MKLFQRLNQTLQLENYQELFQIEVSSQKTLGELDLNWRTTVWLALCEGSFIGTFKALHPSCSQFEMDDPRYSA